ncbi:MAG: DUF4147 domain-containing protein [Acidobacteria bacterium]|nr:DUF4147 domain-containing protein [Acidobacteriota bacterium]
MKDLKEQAKSFFLNALELADLHSLLQQKVQVVDQQLFFDQEVIELNHYDEVLLIGFGKASLTMGATIEAILKDKIKRGILVTNHRTPRPFISEVIVAGHPTPNERSLFAAQEIISALQSATAKTLILFLISGGGSALVELPVVGVTLNDLQIVNKTLVESGATIQEINIIRKKLSQIKGGRLGKLVENFQTLAIYLSDVNEGDLGALASGPLIEEEENSSRLQTIIERYDLSKKLPAAITKYLQREQLPRKEKKRKAKKSKSKVFHLLLLQNRDLLEIAARLASQQGFKVEICSEIVEGNYRVVADALCKKLQEVAKARGADPVCLVSGGEVECPVKAQGIGGRNQEFVLYSAARFAEFDSDFDIAILSGGTDGIDGSSCAAGAVIGSGDSLKSFECGFDATTYIHQNDSHSFLKQTGGLIMTGPTGNNVRDLRILLARPKTKGEKT